MPKSLNKINKICVLVGGGIMLLVAFAVKQATASPYLVLHNTESLVLLPPLWLMGVLWFGGYFLLGAVAGQMLSLSSLPPQMDIRRCKGGLLFVIAAVTSFLWYILLFGSSAFFLSWLMCGLTAMLLIGCAVYWFSVSKGSALIMTMITVGYILLFICQIMVMLHI